MNETTPKQDLKQDLTKFQQQISEYGAMADYFDSISFPTLASHFRDAADSITYLIDVVQRAQTQETANE